jgi:regulator of protease activity HflC (stomatin/prohibitin superfamily)
MTMFRITIPVGFAAVRYARGEFVSVLATGRYRTRPGVRHVLVDLRQRLVHLALQEVPAADGIPVRVTPTLRVAVTDPRLFLEQAQDPMGLVYLAAQIAVRERLAALTAAELTARGALLPMAAILAAANAAGAEVGVTVTDVVIKDVVLPVEIRTAALELATVQQRAAVQLEQARAETAALRSMANAAKLLDDHPALARLRLVQAAGPGARLVLQLSDGPVAEGPSD